MDLGLRNKNVIITGSTSGIGYFTAKSFLDEGAKVLLNGRNILKLDHAFEMLSRLYDDGNILKFQGDLTEKQEINRLKDFVHEHMFPIDCLVINIGSGKSIHKNPLNIDEWREMFQINLFSAVQLIDIFDELWEKDSSGSVVMVSSIAGQQILQAPVAYAAAKDGIRVLSKYLSDRFAPRGIRVNSISPGNVFFEGGRWEELLNKDAQSVNTYIREKVPLQRFAKPEEIADVITFLSSDKASFITGSNLIIDGGQTRQV